MVSVLFLWACSPYLELYFQTEKSENDKLIRQVQTMSKKKESWLNGREKE